MDISVLDLHNSLYHTHNLGQKVLRILHFYTHRTSIPWIGTGVAPPLAPRGSILFRRGQLIQPDFNIVFWGAVQKRGVFVVASAFKSFILKLDIPTSVFLNIFVYETFFLLAVIKQNLRYLYFFPVTEP